MLCNISSVFFHYGVIQRNKHESVFPTFFDLSVHFAFILVTQNSPNTHLEHTYDKNTFKKSRLTLFWLKWHFTVPPPCFMYGRIKLAVTVPVVTLCVRAHGWTERTAALTVEEMRPEDPRDNTCSRFQVSSLFVCCFPIYFFIKAIAVSSRREIALQGN